MNARFYNPSSGRFLSQDSYSGNPQDPWTQHLYAYCGNNPVNMIDPTGHLFQKIVYFLKPIASFIEGVAVSITNKYSLGTYNLAYEKVTGTPVDSSFEKNYYLLLPKRTFLPILI